MPLILLLQINNGNKKYDMNKEAKDKNIKDTDGDITGDNVNNNNKTKLDSQKYQ